MVLPRIGQEQVTAARSADIKIKIHIWTVHDLANSSPFHLSLGRKNSYAQTPNENRSSHQLTDSEGTHSCIDITFICCSLWNSRGPEKVHK